jgi:hypothetical protein
MKKIINLRNQNFKKRKKKKKGKLKEMETERTSNSIFFPLT